MVWACLEESWWKWTKVVEYVVSRLEKKREITEEVQRCGKTYAEGWCDRGGCKYTLVMTRMRNSRK